MIDGMNSQLQLFEADKQEHVGQVAKALQEVYNHQHIPKFAQTITPHHLSEATTSLAGSGKIDLNQSLAKAQHSDHN